MLPPSRKEGNSSLKRDILAVITFVATGFLFYLIQTRDPMEKAPGHPELPGVVENVSERGPLAETPIGVTPRKGGSLDS